MEEVAEWHNGRARRRAFPYLTTRQHALDDLDTFEEIAALRTVQDAMLTGHSNLWHSDCPALNIGLLLPQEVIDGALEKYETGRAPLNSVEGFIRQVLGWREYIRGLYWETMPGLRDANLLKAELPLPAFFWTGETSGLHCLDESIKPVLERGYANHIQRLMVIGNYCLLTGINPREVSNGSGVRLWTPRIGSSCPMSMVWPWQRIQHSQPNRMLPVLPTSKMSDYCSNCQSTIRNVKVPVHVHSILNSGTLCFVTGKRSPKTRDSACSIGPRISGARNNAKRFRGLRLPIAVPSRGHGKLWRTIPVSPRGAVEPTQTGKDIA